MQAATIGGMNHYFGIPSEMAVSCGIMLWLVAFVVVVPVGLALAHREHVSLTKISRDTAKREAEVQASPGN